MRLDESLESRPRPATQFVGNHRIPGEITDVGAPFSIGERVDPEQLRAWEYVGLSGRPGLDKDSVRRFKKGDWTLEVHARKDPRSPTRVVSIRTLAEDDEYWSETRTRTRLMIHKRKQS